MSPEQKNRAVMDWGIFLTSAVAAGLGAQAYPIFIDEIKRHIAEQESVNG